MTTGNWLCAYAITRNRPSTLDIGPVPRLIGYRDLGVVVSEVAPTRFDRIDTLDPVDGTLAELAREHDAVVRAVFRSEPVLPLRFGTVLDGEAAARRLLEAGYDQARDCLDEVAGHREWGVRVRHTEPAATTRPDAAGLTGTQYLVRRRERLRAIQRAREDVAGTAGRLEEALRRHAADSVERARPHGVLVNTAYLVETGREAAFHAEVEWFARELSAAGATVETSGPWPPYSFTDLELGAAAHG
ncbi:Gas vesicle synthesis protein GvpL/GvpF [Amycolatopsis tolypomycina]|uniref:Gas vesicle synthesis protein GvpL/GvpF n=1 Tax=Amycolatopsis tolypomycina TaxID=208445 RepID=A0A1H5D6A2_9PSEU|nr:GvpL/GvpF family gas vesicle protein [Amycolatopsis tolypomycina]SED74268.1 Gas vesicle synthesis protein GvpL/GvpF [Amycolatopsis tolypomycina]